MITFLGKARGLVLNQKFLSDVSWTLTMPNIRLHTARPGLTGDIQTTTSPTESRLYFLDKCSIATMSPSILNVGNMDGPIHYGH
jgi:hypothetical protein